MATKRTATRSDLRAVGVPTQLIDEVLGLGALGLDRPAPTAELVANTLERCRETLERMRPVRQQTPEISLEPAVTPGEISRIAWGQFLGALHASVLDEALPFAAKHPEQSAIVVVDNHAIVDPESWDADPALALLRGTYRTAEEALARVNGRPLCRLIVLKESVNAYDDRDLAAIRRAIAWPARRCTYVVSNRQARALHGRSCTVVGRDVVFELSPKAQSGGGVVVEPHGIRDPARVDNMRHVVSGLQESAMAVYDGDRLNPRLEWALQSDRNDRLRAVLGEMIETT